MVVKKGDRVKVEYTGKLEDGTVFDSSENHGKPLEFEAGEGKLIKGFDEAVLGMKKGEEKEITLQPDEAYGEYDSSLVKELPRNQFPEEKPLEEGMTMMLRLQNGQQIPAQITEVTEENVTLDLNPPLAGKTLHFKIKVVDINT